MEELKILVDMVAHLPQMALWVLVGFLIYKLAIVGSVYGTIRFAVEKFVTWRTYTPPATPPAPKEMTFAGVAINDETAMALMAQLARLSSYGRIHLSDIKRIEKLIDKAIAEKEELK